jgi:hypothetical protein
MSATVGDPSLAGGPLDWSLLFARQPEPDLEFTEEELEQTTNIRSSSPMKSPKKSGGRSLLWILLLVLIGGGAYVAMEPELVTDLVGPLFSESSESTAEVAVKPLPLKPPAPNAPPSQPGPAAVAPTATQSQTPQADEPVPEPSPNTSSPLAQAPMTPAPQPVPAATSQETPIEIAPPSSASPAPLFGEGQRVIVLPNPAAPREKVVLKQDATGTKPGPAVPPGTAFTILDGDLLDTGWVYNVRSDYGTKGWLEEGQLRLKP